MQISNSSFDTIFFTSFLEDIIYTVFRVFRKYEGNILVETTKSRTAADQFSRRETQRKNFPQAKIENLCYRFYSKDECKYLRQLRFTETDDFKNFHSFLQSKVTMTPFNVTHQSSQQVFQLTYLNE